MNYKQFFIPLFTLCFVNGSVMAGDSFDESENSSENVNRRDFKITSSQNEGANHENDPSELTMSGPIQFISIDIPNCKRMTPIKMMPLEIIGTQKVVLQKVRMEEAKNNWSQNIQCILQEKFENQLKKIMPILTNVVNEIDQKNKRKKISTDTVNRFLDESFDEYVDDSETNGSPRKVIKASERNIQRNVISIQENEYCIEKLNVKKEKIKIHKKELVKKFKYKMDRLNKKEKENELHINHCHNRIKNSRESNEYWEMHKHKSENLVGTKKTPHQSPSKKQKNSSNGENKENIHLHK